MRDDVLDQAPGGRRITVSRRRLFQLGTAVGIAAASAAVLPASPGASEQHVAHAADAVTLTKFKDPLPKPRVFTSATGVYTVQMREFKHTLHSELGPVTTVWGYGDALGASYPGPTFEVYTGNSFTVNWQNRLSTSLTATHFIRQDPSVFAAIHGAQDNRKAVVHLHGGHIRADVDGYPEATILPTQDVTYRYDIDQQAATLWYHDHALGNTRLNVYMGLAGFALVRSAAEDNLIATNQLPARQYEFPIAIQDRRIDSKGKLKYSFTFDDSMFGNVAVLNGKIWPYLNVQQRKYRFRLLNGSNSRTYTLQLGNGAANFIQIGSDQGFLAAPLSLKNITLTPGERADVVIDFAQFPKGTSIVLKNLAPSMMMGVKDEHPLPDLMQFRVTNDSVTDNVTLPATLNTITPLNPAAAVTNRRLVLEDVYDPMLGDSMNEINGKHWDDIDDIVRNNTIETWEFINKTDMIHPMHPHLVQFQVLSRIKKFEGVTTNLGVDANERGWKDTVRVGPFETVKVIAHFQGKRNDVASELFPYHCHVLEHEDHEMMRQYRLEY